MRASSCANTGRLLKSNTPHDIQAYITDPIGVRVVCLYEDELEKIAQIVRAHFAVIDVTDKVRRWRAPRRRLATKGCTWTCG